MEAFKVIVAGSRDFDDYQLLEKSLDSAFRNMNNQITIVSGCARGADSLGEKYAKANGYHIERFPANWHNHGKSAGYIRNSEMAEFSDALVAFWDGNSRGTKHMIDLANKNNIQVRVVRY